MSSTSQCNMVKLAAGAGAAAVVLYLVYRKMCKSGCCGGGEAASCCINQKVCKDKDKVADMVDVSDIKEGKTAYCRCWKSEKFPYCDGSHNGHNKETGDNIGPLVITKKSE